MQRMNLASIENHDFAHESWNRERNQSGTV